MHAMRVRLSTATPAASRAAAATFLILVAGCGAKHVQLKFPESEKGDAYVCTKTTESKVNCHPVTKIDPADQNRAGTSFVILPTECKGHFYQITVQDADSSNPTVHVICAPLENVVQ